MESILKPYYHPLQITRASEASLIVRLISNLGKTFHHHIQHHLSRGKMDVIHRSTPNKQQWRMTSLSFSSHLLIRWHNTEYNPQFTPVGARQLTISIILNFDIIHDLQCVGNKTLFLKPVGCENIKYTRHKYLRGKPFLLEGKNHVTNSE